MAHDHDHDHAHGGGSAFLPAALALTLLYAAVEAGAGWWAGSLALLSDAGHMVTDALALGLAAAAAWAARRPPTARLTFGLQRIDILAALGNAGFMLAVILGIAWSAIDRLLHPAPVQGLTVTVVALVGLAVNLLVAWLLMRGEKTLNTRAALLHVFGDLLGSVAALAAGLIIQATGWTPADPLLSVFICALILASTLRLAREAVHALLEGVPAGLSLAEVGRRMATIEGVVSVHDLHIWSLSSNQAALSAHVVLREFGDWPRILAALGQLLEDEFRIGHATLQPELYRTGLYRIEEPAEPPNKA
ncbi:MAG TPA: cation diffusion facilitator family transporter [Candidatus Desulfobacillus sp.]|nr:cation diffusion facilitator family transporter [Candidatus Desulfobacillus sp.]